MKRFSLALACFLACTFAANANTIKVAMSTQYPICWQVCENWQGHVSYVVHYANLPAGSYRINSSSTVVVDFTVASTGSGTVAGDGTGDYFENYQPATDGQVAKDAQTNLDTGEKTTGLHYPTAGGALLIYGLQSGSIASCPPPCPFSPTLQQFVVHLYVNGAVPDVMPTDANETGPCDDNTGCPFKGPMATYSIHFLLANLHIEDTPISYASPRGPAVEFRVAYNHREANQPTFYFSNFGAKWTHNWLSYVTDDPANPANASVYARGGGTEVYSGYNSTSQTYAPDAESMAVLSHPSAGIYQKDFPDGSKEIFSVSDGATSYPRRIFLSSVVDPAGNAVTLTYDGSLRLTTLTDPLGQATVLAYDLPTDPLKITKVTDPFGRFAQFDYTNGQLTKITDPVGIQSQFIYDIGGDFINTLTTPSGNTTFAQGGTDDSLRWLEAIDPEQHKERVEYDNYRSDVASSEAEMPPSVYNTDLQFRNTFYWNKKAMAEAPGDYSKAQVIHWLTTNDGRVSGIKHSKKQPLENRVWYSYSGQTNDAVGSNALPTQVARVLDDGTTQLSQFAYNTNGNVTKETDPAGRATSYQYDSNGIDLLAVYRERTGGASTDPFGAASDKLASFGLYVNHKPQTVTDASNESTAYAYNSYGQIHTVTNAKSEITTYVYDRDQNSDGVTDGYLLTVTGAVTGSTTTYHYDSAKRVDTLTDSEGYLLTFGYDNIDRPTSITYPDTTTKQFNYTKYVNGSDTGIMTLDLGASKDRRGQWTYREYNGNRQLTKITDPLSRNTLFDWCSCGALGSITDGSNHVTTFIRDIESRVISKQFDDTKSIAYVYEDTTSRLKSMTDANNQITNYSYFIDDDLQQISYSNAVVATPSVSFTYDPYYQRVATMADGTGTTTYSYNPITGSVSLGAGQLGSIDGPLANDTIAYSYDELGRRLSASVNSVAASQTFDSLGRVGTITNPLGTFTNTFLSTVSPRLQSTTVSSGPSVTYSYYANSADKRLQTILNKTAGGTLFSQFDHFYDADGEIYQLNKQLGSGTSNSYVWGGNSGVMNDAADQLKWFGESVGGGLGNLFQFSYDNAGNQLTNLHGSFTYNDVNQITNTGYVYDNNGNLTSDPYCTYQWDGANRLVVINYNGLPNNETDFTYDGLGRRVKIVEKGMAAPVIDYPFAVAGAKNYHAYQSTPSVSLAAGTYVLTITGTNPNGGTNTALLDSVKVGSVSPGNSSFETPSASGVQFDPVGATWTFTGTSGIAHKNSSLVGSVAIPDGTQVGFVQNNSSISQTLTLSAGTYYIKVQGAQAGNNTNGAENVEGSLQNTAQVITSTKQFIWDGNSIAEERDANNNVLRRFYPQGEQISGTKYFYTRDQLGSVRELVDTTGAIRTRYDYDPFGQRTKLSGDLDAEFGYTGFYYHQPSGLNLALYRAYDATSGRWLSRDPIGENGGLNLYAYGANDPVNIVDPEGLRPLRDCEKQLLAPYIPQVDLNNADLHDGTVPFWLRKNFEGVTIHNNIYFRPGVYNPSTVEGLAKLAHELVHVGQYRNGMSVAGYLAASMKGYWNNPYEKPAYAMQDKVRNTLHETCHR